MDDYLKGIVKEIKEHKNKLKKVINKDRQKKYQYLYLKEKTYLNFKYLDEFSHKGEFERIQFYKDWLMKLNEKYSYTTKGQTT